MIGLLAGLILQLSPEAWIANKFFASDTEATNFSAHVGWGMGVTALGYGLGGKRGALISSGAWVGYSLLNEFCFHHAESAHERNLNLISRLGSAALTTGLLLIFGR